MKVKKLIKMLQKLDPEFIVVMSKDGEGNSYSPLAALDEAHYTAESTWSGEIDDPDHPHEDGNNAVVLWPTN